MNDPGTLLNAEEVDFLLEAEGSAGKAIDPSVTQEVTMRGDLEQISLSDIFQTLAMAKMEGLLRVRNPLEQRLVHFRDGYVRILVPNRVAFRRLGQRLVQAGLLQQDALRAALLEQRRKTAPLGQILVQHGYVTQEQVEEVVASQIHEELFALFTWRHGSFEFYKGKVSDPDVVRRLEQCIDFEVNSLLLESARRTDEWECIARALGNLDEIPAVDVAAAEAALGDLPEACQELLRAVDGRQSYRELADVSLTSLFDAARNARVLAERGVLHNLDDAAMVEVARHQFEMGNPKRALVTIQTLRDRDGVRAIPVLVEIADLLRRCGEGRLASAMLLDAAHQAQDPQQALELAQRARTAVGRDADVLWFLRECLLRCAAPAAEVEEATLALLDEWTDLNRCEPAMALVAECEANGTATPSLLARKVRLQQKQKDIAGAVATLTAIAEQHLAAGNRLRAIDAYSQILKLDRARRDVARMVKALRRTRAARITRLCVYLATGLLAVTAAVVMVHRQRIEVFAQRASTEITALLRAGDLAGARAALEVLRNELGEEPVLDDLQRQIEFATAAEVARLRRAERLQALEQLAEAARMLSAGDLAAALAQYARLHGRADLKTEVQEVVATRLEAIASDLEQTGKFLHGQLPPAPSAIPDRRMLRESLATLRTRYQPAQLELARTLTGTAAPRMPDFVPAALTERLTRAASVALPLLQIAQQRIQQLEEAAERVEAERRLDPLWKAALDHERSHDFTSALAAYRRLEQLQTDGDLRAHFRDQVERNAAIIRLLEAIAAATKAGDFSTAQSQYRALKLSFPDLPFERIARLPLRIDSRPGGATVLWNDQPIGTTPLMTSYLPADSNTVTVRLEGFQDEMAVVTGDRVGAVVSTLAPRPAWELTLDGIVEQPCTTDGHGRVFAVDRAGILTAVDGNQGSMAWRWRSGDLSGLLSAPIRFEGSVLVCSLDGTVRSIDRGSGRVAWSAEGLATEVGPALVDSVFAVATHDRRLVLLDAATGIQLMVLPLPGRVSSDLCANGSRVLATSHDGELIAHELPGGKVLWRQRLERASGLRACAIPQGFAVASDNGNLAAVDAATGAILWRTTFEGPIEGVPVCSGQQLGVTLPTRCMLLDPATGKVLAQVAAPEEPWSGPPVFLTDRIAVPVRNGTMRVLAADGMAILYQLRSDRKLNGRATAGPGRSLLVGTQDRKLLLYRSLP